MKFLKTSITVSLILVSTLVFISCKNDKKSVNDNMNMNDQTEMSNESHDMNKGHDNSDGHHKKDNAAANDKRDITASTQKNAATTPIVEAYFQIKNGLVADDKKAAAKGGEAMVTAFSKFDMSTLSGETHTEYMEILESAKEHAEHIVKSPIDHQREHFEMLTTDINDLITLLGTEKKIYQDFCPMTNDGKGAIWLSEFKEIKNPYLGSKMLTCGSVQKEI